jgi:acyl carrier protein
MNELFMKDFSSVIELSVEAINDDLDLQGMLAWDSLAYLSTIALIDRHFSILFDNDDLKSIRYFKDLKLLIIDRLK